MNVPSLVFSVLGGILVGSSASLVLAVHGKVAGISGIYGGVFRRDGDRAFRLSFLAGLLVGGAILAVARPSAFAPPRALPIGAVVVAGLLVGFGAQLGNGCTSGHGVCGVARASSRSLVATAVFMGTGILAAVATHHTGLLP